MNIIFSFLWLSLFFILTFCDVWISYPATQRQTYVQIVLNKNYEIERIVGLLEYYISLQNGCVRCRVTHNLPIFLYSGNRNLTYDLNTGNKNISVELESMLKSNEFKIELKNNSLGNSLEKSCEKNPICKLSNLISKKSLLASNDSVLNKYTHLVISDKCIWENAFENFTQSNANFKSHYALLLQDRDERPCESNIHYRVIPKFDNVTEEEAYMFLGDQLEYSVNLVENTFNFLIYLDRLKWYVVRDYIKDVVFPSASNITKTERFTFYFYVIRRYYSYTIATEFVVPCVKGKQKEFVEYFDFIKKYIFQKYWPHYYAMKNPPPNFYSFIKNFTSIYQTETIHNFQYNLIITDIFQDFNVSTNVHHDSGADDFQKVAFVLYLNDDENETNNNAAEATKNSFENWKAKHNYGDYSEFHIINYQNYSDIKDIIPYRKYEIPKIATAASNTGKHIWLIVIIPTVAAIALIAIIIIAIIIKKDRIKFFIVKSFYSRPYLGTEYTDLCISEDEIIVNDKDKLGEGHSSIVYSATIKNSSSNYCSNVAIKILTKFSSYMDFENELKMCQKLKHHPYLCLAIGWTTYQGIPCLIFDQMNTCLYKHVKNNSKSKNNKLFPSDLYLQFLWQISDALKYVASKNLVHRDVAARNILISHSNVAKLGDFELCSECDDYSSIYMASSKHKTLPWRWLSIEALTNRIFSESSDIWSFGIVMYEIWSFGALPYYNIKNMEGLIEFLKNDKRLEPPKFMPWNIIEIMKSCWLMKKENRPTFEKIQGKLFQLLEEEEKNAGYLQIFPDPCYI